MSKARSNSSTRRQVLIGVDAVISATRIARGQGFRSAVVAMCLCETARAAKGFNRVTNRLQTAPATSSTASVVAQIVYGRVPQSPGAAEMAHADDEFRLQPLGAPFA